MARFILCPFGSGGDVNPHIWLGKLLKQRGHEVVMVTAPLFETAAKRAGLEFRGVGSAEEYEAIVHDPRLWHPLRATEVVFAASAKAMEPFLEAIGEEVRAGDKGRVVIVAPFHLPAARLAREVYGVPLVTVHLQPIAMFSAHDKTVFLQSLRWMANMPVWMKKLFFSLPNPADLLLGPEVRKMCVKYGVKPPKRWLTEWTHSPDGVLCLWPEWFAGRQPDWPVQAQAVGFPMEDLKGQVTWPTGLREFLAEGSKPVLLTAGTGNAQAGEFFSTGMTACEKLGVRMLLGTRYRVQLPEVLPEGARWFEYLPFGELLPSVAAVVHHGGVGTMSQAFAAGVPQVVVPLAHDQPDNAARMERLGTGGVVTKMRDLQAVLGGVLGSAEVKAKCAEVAEKCREDRAAQGALQMLEGTLDRH